MNIREFIADYGRRQLAADLDVSTSLVSHWSTGRRSVGARHVRTLVALSEGRLKAEDLRPDVFGEAQD